MTVSAFNPQAELFGLGWPNADEALAFATGALAPGPVFVWRAGGVTDAPRNIFGTWPELYAAAPLVGPWVLLVDMSIGGQMPAGDWTAKTQCVYVWAGSNGGGTRGPQFNMQAGCFWARPPMEVRGVAMFSQNTDPDFPTFGTLDAEQRPMLLANGAEWATEDPGADARLVHLDNGAQLIIEMFDSALYSYAPAANVVGLANGSGLTLHMYGQSGLGENAVTGDGSCSLATIRYSAHADVAPQSSQQVTTVWDALRSLVFAGTLTTAIGATEGWLDVQPSSAPVAAADPAVPMQATSVKRHTPSLAINVHQNSADSDTFFEVWRDGGASSIVISVLAGQTGLFYAGPLSSDAIAADSVATLSVKVYGNYGAAGNTVRASANLEVT